MDDPRKWVQVKADLLRQLDTGVLEPGDEVTPKHEASDHGVSEMTARAAIRSLAREGRLERRDGRYVVPDRVIDNPDPLQAAERGGVWSSVASSLRDKITSGKIEPGTPLQRRSLAGEYGVSPETISHALESLERRGIVKEYRGIGYLANEVSDGAAHG